MLTMITRETIEHFDKVIPALARTLQKTTLSDNWSIQSLYDHVVNYQAYIFFQHESQYAGVFTINQSPLSRNLYFFWAGKDRENKVPINHAEVDKFLVAAAKYFQCNHITCEGRKGWGKVIAPYGYREDSRVYIKEVSHELPEIQPIASDGREPDDGRQCELPI